MNIWVLGGGATDDINGSDNASEKKKFSNKLKKKTKFSFG